MSRLQFFITSSAVIFLLERILPSLISVQIFFFPVFVILFILTSRDEARELSYIVIPSIFFDVFAGFYFGLFTGSILILYLLICLFKKMIKVEADAYFLIFIYSVFFSFAFIVMISTPSSIVSAIVQWRQIISQTIIVFIVFLIFSRRLTDVRTG